jgi:hypothetical protein
MEFALWFPHSLVRVFGVFVLLAGGGRDVPEGMRRRREPGQPGTVAAAGQADDRRGAAAQGKWWLMSDEERPAPVIDTTMAHSARVWNYWLGGKDNYAVDRAAGDQYLQVFPGIVDVARSYRAFLARAVRYLAGEAGIRQFLDVGTGLPTVGNTHELAQQVSSDCRIVYADNDPLVLAHARALLTSTPEGECDYLDADLHDPGSILAGAAKTLDLGRPVALMLISVLGHRAAQDEALSIVRTLMAGLCPGSYLAITLGTDTNEAFSKAQQEYNASGAVPYVLRRPEQVPQFFEGLELVEPGVVPASQWRPDPGPLTGPQQVYAFGGVGRKP